MSFRILFKNELLLAVEKPTGIPSVEQVGGQASPLAAWLRDAFPEVSTLGEGPRPAGQVHRLDTATSGILLVARTPKSYERLRAAFSRPGAVRKTYDALLMGRLQRPLRCHWPIGARGRSSSRVVVAKAPVQEKRLRGVRPARSFFEPIKFSEAVTWAKVQIETGVRHQIRAHAAAVGHAVLGDPLYGGAKGIFHEKDGPSRGEAATQLPADCEARLYLHASTLEIPAPVLGEKLLIESPAPKCFERCFSALSR